MSDEPDLNAEWHADRRAHRLRTIQQQRPVMLRHEGELDPRVEAWGRSLVAGTAMNLILVGSVGRTKTWSAWEVLERAVANGYAGWVDFATVADWQDATTPPVDKDRLKAMRVADMLVLDDLGSARINDWQRECMLSVIDERWQHARPTIITTNMQKLTEPLGERLASRIKDGATLVALGGEDRRSGR
ncbi:ATP-binding protein [Microtetraspora sp. AC03309]|uniref:ATP-binding protein n=1 Tax=Microtetraspora sp. AC03309 TaxID=2779376 RepID=UPI001E50C50C|nr:ATP-binding protein [Microtetraspora sp. AC03309]MCC5574533.1 ATP-binding protein [Microtetraspora sp. AC03309]